MVWRRSLLSKLLGTIGRWARPEVWLRSKLALICNAHSVNRSVTKITIPASTAKKTKVAVKKKFY